jgi:IclR family acetate operon transcriptional repressor
MAKQEATKPASGVRLVERTFDVLFALGDKAKGCNLGDLCRATGLSGATALRILRTLATLEVVAIDKGKKIYHLGPAMYRLATASLDSNQFKPVVQHLLDQLRDEINETICIFQRGRNDRVCIAVSHCARELSFSIEPGQRRSMLLGAPGKVLLAHMSEAERQVFYRGLPARQRAAIEAELKEVLKNGVLYSRDELVLGGAALSAPIVDGAGQVSALTILGPAARLNESSIRAQAASLRAIAAEITKRLGGRIPDVVMKRRIGPSPSVKPTAPRQLGSSHANRQKSGGNVRWGTARRTV